MKLGTCVSVTRGTTLSGEFYSEKGTNIRLTLGNFNYPGGGFKKNTSKKDIFFTGNVKDEFVLKKDDIITPLTEQVSGLLGETAKIPESNKYIQSGDIGLLKPDLTKINPDFLYYLLPSKYVKNQLGSAAQQTKIRHTSPKKIMDCYVYLPDLDSQKKIGTFLAKIDLKIRNNSEQIKTLESLAKTIYDYWFVQFDFPNEDGKPYKSSGGKMVWNEELKKEIPEKWISSNIGSFVSEQIRGDWGKESVEGNYTEKVVCIRGTDLSSLESGLLSAPTRYILKKNSGLKLKNGDVIVEISGGSPTQSTGRISYVNENTLKRGNCDLIASNFCKVLRLKSCSQLYFFYCFWNDIYSRGIFYRYEGKTTGIKNLMLDMFLDSFRLAIPSNIDLFMKFDNIVSPMYEKIQKLNLESEKLHSIKYFLLSLLMNGQVTLQ